MSTYTYIIISKNIVLVVSCRVDDVFMYINIMVYGFEARIESTSSEQTASPGYVSYVNRRMWCSTSWICPGMCMTRVATGCNTEAESIYLFIYAHKYVPLDDAPMSLKICL